MKDVSHDPAIPEDGLPSIMARMEATGVKIRFREMEALVDPAALKDARDFVASLDFRKRLQVLASVGMALDKSYPKMVRGNFKKKVADNFYADILLFEAFRLSHLH